MNDRLSFASDYLEGAHPSILKRLADTNKFFQMTATSTLLGPRSYMLIRFAIVSSKTVISSMGHPQPTRLSLLLRISSWLVLNSRLRSAFGKNTMKRIRLFDLPPAGPHESKTLISSANLCVSLLNCRLGFSMRLLLFKTANVIINILSQLLLF